MPDKFVVKRDGAGMLCLFLFLTSTERVRCALPGRGVMARTIMKRAMLLIAVLWSGEICEAELHPNENVEDAKNAVYMNYCLPCGAVKEWRIER